MIRIKSQSRKKRDLIRITESQIVIRTQPYYWLTLSNTRPQTCMTNVTELDQRFAHDLVSDQ